MHDFQVSVEIASMIVFLRMPQAKVEHHFFIS